MVVWFVRQCWMSAQAIKKPTHWKFINIASIGSGYHMADAFHIVPTRAVIVPMYVFLFGPQYHFIQFDVVVGFFFLLILLLCSLLVRFISFHFSSVPSCPFLFSLHMFHLICILFNIKFNRFLWHCTSYETTQSSTNKTNIISVHSLFFVCRRASI